MVDVPTAVRQKAEALGEPGEQWLADLNRIVEDLEADWGFEAGSVLSGGSSAYVAAAITTSGEAAVLKVVMPAGLEGNGPFENELLALSLGSDECYVRVLQADIDRRAMLQERLGRSLSRCGLAVEVQIEILASTMQRGWRRPPDTVRLPTGADQARWLGRFIQRKWDELVGPCPRHVVDRAVHCTETRYAAFDASTAVLIHGDAHPSNLLEDLSQSRRFKLIDPEGLVSEPAHDLGIPIRTWTDELLDGDAVALGRSWCAQLGSHAGVDDAAIWEWAFIELVSTGLFLLHLGDGLGHRLLEVADRWTP